MNVRDVKKYACGYAAPMLQFFSTRFARINLLTRAWFDREKGGCPFRIQYKTRRIHLSPSLPPLSLPTASLSFLSFSVWVSRDDLRCSSTATERKRESNVDRWRRCVLVAVAYFSSTWNRYARIHLSYDTSIWERDQDRPTEPIPVNPAINYNRSRVRTFNVLQITLRPFLSFGRRRDYVWYQTRIDYLFLKIE